MNDDTENLESVADLMRRLGPPPDDIWDAWCEETRSLDWTVGLHHPGSPETDELGLAELGPDSPVWSRVYVGHDGHLRASEPMIPPEEVPLPATVVVADRERKRSDANAQGFEKIKHRGKSTVVWVAGGSVALIGLAILGWTMTKSPSSRSDSSSASATNPGSADVFAPGRVPGMETARPRAGTRDSSAAAPPRRSRPSTNPAGRSTAFSLDAFMPAGVTDTPPADNLAADDAALADPAMANAAIIDDDGLTEKQADEQAVAPENSAEELATSMTPTADLLADTADEDDDMPSQARSAVPAEPAVDFLTLPDLPRTDQEGVPIRVPAFRRGGELTLQFPSPATTQFSMRPAGGDTDDARDAADWEILDTDKDIVLAVLEAAQDDPDSLQWRWLPAASGVATASDLSHGRLVGPEGSVDLRPTLETQSIDWTLDDRDLKWKWDLGSPPPPAISRLAVNATLPPELEIGWIEPIDESSPRKTRGVAVLTLRDNENVAVAFRLDITTGRSLSMRLRTGGRLATGMPWQWTDRPSVQETLAAVTQQSMFVQNQVGQFDAAIAQAKRVGARRQAAMLSLQQEPLRQQVAQLQSASQAIADLERLMSFASQVRLDMKLTVTWPDREQILLQTKDRP